jgi:predicted nuclease of restriction endonuclease-like RecB superfamily
MSLTTPNPTRNEFERVVDKQLKRSKVTYSYESEKIPYILYGNYIPDFILETKDGKVYIECKGHFRVEDKRKLSAVKKQYPDMDLRIVFYSSKPKDIKWAEKRKIPWAVGKIPREWLK